jgi:hypothetical protein
MYISRDRLHQDIPELVLIRSHRYTLELVLFKLHRDIPELIIAR